MGLTNGAKGLIAEFCVTNAHGYRGWLGWPPVEVPSRSSWHPSRVPGDLTAVELPRSCVTNVFIAVPSGSSKWSMQVLFLHEPSVFEKAVRKVTDLVGWQMPDWHRDSIRVYAAEVPEVDR